MSLFYAHYGCHEGALVMRKSDGAIYIVRGNVSMWDMTALVQLWDVENDQPVPAGNGLLSVKPGQFALEFFVLDPSTDRLTEKLKRALSQIASGKTVT